MNRIILLYISDSNKSSSSPVVFTDIPFNSQQVSFSVSLSNYNSFIIMCVQNGRLIATLDIKREVP